MHTIRLCVYQFSHLESTGHPLPLHVAVAVLHHHREFLLVHILCETSSAFLVPRHSMDVNAAIKWLLRVERQRRHRIAALNLRIRNVYK